jgi:hypothetical protein
MISLSITGGTVHLSGNPIEVKIMSSGNAGKSNYKLALKISCNALMGSPFIEEIAPVSLVSTFDISGFADQPVDYSFDYPTIGAVNPHDLLAFHVTLDIGEIWNDNNGDRQESWSNLDPSENTIRILKGKLFAYELAILNETGKSFATEYINGGRFLTHLPDYQRVSPSHNPILWYLSRWTDSHDITLNLKVNTNNKVAHLPITQNHTIYDITGLVEFAFQPLFWGFDLDPGELIESYEFWITDVNGDISEHRTYLVDNSYYEKSFTFYYVNPLSGIDLIWLTGEYSFGLKTESETAIRPVAVGSGTRVATLRTISSSAQRSWEINTGPKSRKEMRSLRDFLIARQCWMVDPDDSARVIPVLIEPGDSTLFDSREDIQNLTIKILEAHR